jgi:Flp pilus assembly protein TadB
MAAKTDINSHDDKRAPENGDRRAPEYKDADRQAKRQTNQQPEERTVVPATRTRQAVGGHNARYVLAFGLAAVIIVFVAIYLVYFA